MYIRLCSQTVGTIDQLFLMHFFFEIFYSDTKNYAINLFQKTTLAQHSVPGDSRPAPFKMPAFVPPFIKSAKTETGKDPVLKENARVPTFVPPFKKQKTALQESFSKQEVENKHYQPLTAQPTSSAYVPPTKKTKDTTDVIVSVGTANTNMMNNQCGASASSGPEASHVDVTSSKNEGTESFFEKYWCKGYDVRNLQQ